ncbi:hypothetical protein B0H14DRAFT_3100616 [Mycena olivaceomarginata]|nr:hypothetical protein B0H14DRAFT_3100616 [Mycena olivaceomarginata]
MILWLLKQCKVAGVPSYSGFRKLQDHLRGLCGSEPQDYTSGMGNRFFVNDVRESIARDFSNPEIVKHLNFYPEETLGPISEVWQAERWKEFKPSELTPMYSRGLRQFYINEVAQLHNGKKVIPLTWIRRMGTLCTDCLEVTPAASGWEIGQDVQSVAATEFPRTGDRIKWADSNAPEMPNPLRAIAGEDDLYVVMQYNKHMNMYMANSNLPGRLLQQEYFVRFVSTSPHTGSPEQFSAIKEQIQATHTNPIRCYNAETHRNCRVILRRRASHMGGNANCGCRRCKAGGSHDYTESDKGYHSMHDAGLPRFAVQTKHTLETQIKLAMHGVEAPILKLQTATGMKDKVAQYWIDILLEKARRMKAEKPGRSGDAIAEELQQWLDDQPGDKALTPIATPQVELLHTILLGIIKYEQRNLFVIRLQSTDIDRLTIPPIRAAYMMHTSKHLCRPWCFICMASSLLKCLNSEDSPKIKIHLLTHIVEDVIRFGPAIRNSTEIFECFNAIFRLCSILSNHQAPSRDIARKFASMDRLKHILCGGFWKQDNTWVQAASNVREVLQTMPIIQRHLGWAPPQKIIVAMPPEVVAPSVHWRCALSQCPSTHGYCNPGAFLVSEELHPDFDMPVLCRPSDASRRAVTVLSDAILFRFSAQHDCRLVDCQPTAFRRVVQERRETSQTTALISHERRRPLLHQHGSIHNATLLRRALPIALTVPRPLYLDRKSHHYGITTGLRVTQTMKRARTQEKRESNIGRQGSSQGLGKRKHR